MRISTKQMDRILAKHGVKGDTKALQRAYRLSVGQRLIADVRDEEGRREILAARENGGTEYIVLDACGDPEKINGIQLRLRAQVMGLTQTTDKVSDRGGILKRVARRLRSGGRRV